MKKSQTGSGHIAIIIVLVAAILGLLGFVFWQNFMNKPATTSSITTPAPSKNAETATSNKTLAVKEWSVKGIYSGGITYGYVMDGYGGLTFTSASLPADCASLLGYISRAKADEMPNIGGTGNSLTAKELFDQSANRSGYAHVGTYYYFLTGPQSACSTDADTAAQGAVVSAENLSLSSLTAL